MSGRRARQTQPLHIDGPPVNTPGWELEADKSQTKG